MMPRVTTVKFAIPSSTHFDTFIATLMGVEELEEVWVWAAWLPARPVLWLLFRPTLLLSVR